MGENVVYAGSPQDVWLQEIGSPQDTVKDISRSHLTDPGAWRADMSGRSFHIESSRVSQANVLDKLHVRVMSSAKQGYILPQGLVGPLPAELSFLVSSAVTQEPDKKPSNPFAERLKHLICSSVLLAGPGAALLQYSAPPKSLQRGSTSFVASMTAALLAAVTTIKTRPIWSIISVLAFVWTYYTSRVRRGETRLTELQRTLLEKVEVLLHYAQRFDTSVQRAMSLIREVECVSRGWGLSSPFPPISRLEQASFGFSGLIDGVSGTGLRGGDETSALRAVDVRRVLQQSLRDARQMCKATCSILERFIKGGEDGEELKGLYAAYGVTPEPVQLASLALSGKRPQSFPPQLASPAPLRQRDRESLRSSMSRSQGYRLPVITSLPGSPNALSRDEQLASSYFPSSGSPPLPQSADLERRPSSRASSRPRSNRSSALFASKPAQSSGMEVQGSDYGLMGEDLSLATIDGAMELLHADRQRTLCHLLAFNHEVNSEGLEERLQSATDAVAELADRFKSGNEAVVAAAEREFGHTCLTPSAAEEKRSVPGAFPIASNHAVAASQSAPDPPRNPRETHSTETLRGFAPPLPAGHRERAHIAAFSERTNAMTLALRSVTAKLHVAGTDLRASASSPTHVEEQDRIIKMHDSIRNDLETLMREWDQSRVALRSALTPPQPVPRPRRQPDAAVDEIDADLVPLTEEEVAEIDRRSSTISSEVLTPDDLLSPELATEEVELLDNTIEQVFEGTGGSPERVKLSRGERIRAAKEKREQDAAMTAVPRPDVNMVVELKDVLKELSSRRSLK